ncbi:hypothetical protein IPH19_03780 [Candidatus Uhrbacteria bacterium]|nr:MAG: hypothetical protein IPH19_03780 [Candidatus Uhrbacteria bacterium]
MGHREWLKAAETVEAQKRQPEVEAREIEEEARKLESFLSSVEGNAARRLLKATAKHIIVGELEASPGHAMVCFLDGEGLRQSIEGKGLSGAYAGNKPDISSTTPELATKAFTHPDRGKRKPSELLNYIRGELDKIAEAVKKG